MEKQRLLALFAHPDDETFGAGGTMAHYADEGVQVVLVCATRGEEGEISDLALATPETLAEVREGELRCAAKRLGVAELHFLGYRDSGMEGTAPNEAESAFINQPAEKVVRALVAIIRRVRPQVLITFDPNGGYGHPDHIAIHHHTVAAFTAASDPDYEPSVGEPWQPSRLFYNVIPRSAMRAIREQMQEAGEADDLIEQMEESEMGWPDEEVDLVLDVSAYADRKWEALNCHRTQFGPNHPIRRMATEGRGSLLHQERFVLAVPDARPEALDGLFAALA